MGAETSRVAVIGDALIDEFRDDRGVREFVGGAALNVAVGLARLGVPATLIAMVGDDAPGDHIRSYLATFGVELLASPSPHGTARAVSTRSGGGEPEYVFNHAARERRIRFGDAERAVIAASPLTAVSCVALDDEPQATELAESLSVARVAIDANPRAGMMNDPQAFVRGFERIAAHAELVKVGADDAALLVGIRLDEFVARIRGWGATAVLATRGADGASIETDAGQVSRPISALPGRIVDTMGAGDAAFATVVAALVAGGPLDWEEALGDAMDIAAATCRFEGALLRTTAALDSLDTRRVGS